MRLIRGVAQHYEWGDTDAIPRLLGQADDGRPWAEWWLGTHAGGPSHFADDTTLGSAAGELPYLLKLLAAAEPLSLQTHPDTATAQAGFARERAAGIAIDDPARIYRDPYAKPELLCALAPFDTLCGFRPPADTEALLHALGAHELASVLHHDGLEATVSALYRGTIASAPLVQACQGHPSPQAQLVNRLEASYPGDASVAVTLFLHRVRLQPGEALYLGPGNLHAYLDGVGVEVMGASDNVVRGGLTSKHVDVDELLRVLSFEPLADPVVRPEMYLPHCWRYATPDAPFELHRFDIDDVLTYTAHSREVLLCTDGDSGVLRRGAAGYLAPGESVTLAGPSTVFCVVEN